MSYNQAKGHLIFLTQNLHTFEVNDLSQKSQEYVFRNFPKELL